MSELTRPIIGIENRTAQEVFDIMCDRFRRTPSPSPALGVVEATGALQVALDLLQEKIYGNPARSAAHNAQHYIKKALASLAQGGDGGLAASPAAQVAEAGVEDHPRDTNSVVYHNPPSVIDNATLANPAQVTDAMVEAAMSAPPIPGRGPNVFDPDRMRSALAAAIGAGSRLNMPVGDDQKYRLLEAGEIIASDDEFIGDDGITWERVKGWPVGYTYTHIFKSCRRPLAAARAGEDGR